MRTGSDIARALRRAARRVTGPHLPGPVLVYQVGKVGSTSVHRSLLDAGLGMPVHHAHLLADLDRLEAGVRQRYAAAGGTLRQIEKGRAIRAALDADPDARWSVITMTRDPVAQNVSAFFQRLPEIAPELADDPAAASVEELTAAFHERYHDHDAPAQWFDRQFAPVFGVDLLSLPFDRERGWAIHDAGRHRVLVTTLESLDERGGEAIAALLGLRSFRLRRRNEGAAKGYADAYERFRAAFRPTEDYLARMYGTRMARHFYSPADLERFAARWRGDP